MHEMMDFRLAKQRQEELLREAELSRQARALRATCKQSGGGSRRSALVWEIKRRAGRFLKFLRTLRDVS